MPFPNDKLTPASTLTVAQAEDLTGATISDWDLDAKADLTQEIPRPWPRFSFAESDRFGFCRHGHPGNHEIRGFSAGKPGQVPLLLFLLMQDTNCFKPRSGLHTLFLVHRLFRWSAAITREGGALRRAAWHDKVDIDTMAPIPRHLHDLRQRCVPMGLKLGISGMELPITSMLAYAMEAAYPNAGSTVLCCSRELMNYWSKGPFPDVAKAAHALLDDLLARGAAQIEANGMNVIDGKWLDLPGYEPLFDTEDMGMF